MFTLIQFEDFDGNWTATVYPNGGATAIMLDKIRRNGGRLTAAVEAYATLGDACQARTRAIQKHGRDNAAA